VPRVPILRRRRGLCAGLILGVTACSIGEGAPTVPDDSGYRLEAAEFAAAADRALDGTRFEEVSVGDVAAIIVGLCAAGGSVEAAIDGLAAADGPASDDSIMREVLVEGVAQVCPARSGDAEALDAYLSSVRAAVASSGVDLVLDDEPLIAAGTVVCASLDAAQGVDGAILAAVAILYGLEASSVEELDDVIDGPQGVAVGATLASAAEHLCPQHRPVVAEFVEGG